MSDAPSKDRLPPGQTRVRKWPVLTFGPTPRIAPADWKLRVVGHVAAHVELRWDDLLALPQTRRTSDFHCVTAWSRLDLTWEGVLFRDLWTGVQPLPGATHVLVHCLGGYTTNLPLEALLDDDVIFAHRVDGVPLEAEHGGPVRLVVPRRYAWKSAKWVNGLEVLDRDKPGFWEQNGYHNDGNPWREERRG